MDMKDRVKMALETDEKSLDQIVAPFARVVKEPEQQKVLPNEPKANYDEEDLIGFDQLLLAKPLVRACTELGYEHPTVIQRKAIPSILSGHDV